jgi:7,8-dihydropterin-6-yl-methyl-4-(beta-D-ribofuranosyl)aminobenzene 5'-phosphate synthase
MIGMAVGAALLLTVALEAQEPRRITVIYDAFGAPSELERDWGFAALVEHGGRRILFDTGNDAAIFERNVRALGVDLARSSRASTPSPRSRRSRARWR